MKNRRSNSVDSRALAAPGTTGSAVPGRFDATTYPPEASEPVSAGEAAWLERRIQRVLEIMGDLDDEADAPDDGVTVFLDLDDVVCLCDPYGGRDAIEAIRAKRSDENLVFDALFHKPAVDALRAAHDALDGGVRSVISSTWRLYVNRSEMAELLRRAGLSFVAANLESRQRWSTPDWSLDGHSRLDEICDWLRQHGRGEAFLILDDTFSGLSLVRAAADQRHQIYGRVVICEPKVGLQQQHTDKMVKTLRMPLQPPEAPSA